MTMHAKPQTFAAGGTGFAARATAMVDMALNLPPPGASYGQWS